MMNIIIPRVYIEKDSHTIQCVGYFPDSKQKVKYGVKKTADDFIQLCDWARDNFLTNKMYMSNGVIIWLIGQLNKNPKIVELFRNSRF